MNDQTPGSPAQGPRAHLADLLDAVPFGVELVGEQDGRVVVTFANRRFCELLGIEASDVIGQEDAAALEHIARRLGSPLDLPTGNPPDERVDTHRILSALGRNRAIECSSAPVRDETGRIIGRVRVLSDVTDTESADRALGDSETRLAGIVASAMDAIITVDEDQRIVVFNAAAERTFGIPAQEAIGQQVERFLPERFRATHREHVLEFGRTNVTKRSIGRLNVLMGVRASGEEFPMEASISHVEIRGRKLYTVILRDITEKRSAEAQLMRAQRLESIGTLASGLAHDLNNILAPIMVSVSLLERKLAADPEGLEYVAMLGQLADRGANVVRKVLSFARGVEGDRVPMDLRPLIREVADLLRETLPRSIFVRLEVTSELWIARADGSQIHQVLMNLAVNARDAMPAGGTLTLAAENVTLDERMAGMQPDARPGRYIAIAVADTGIGISPEHLERIFEPFFTTKPLGEGTGLGLSTSLGIVRSHEGFIRVSSEPGHGTRFTVHLPASPLGFGRDEPMEPAEAPAQPAQGDALILLVDDEATIRELTGRMLTASGYRVLTAENGAEAVALFARHQGEVAAVVLDMMMPLMNGEVTARALKGMDPGLCIIGSSGLVERSGRVQADELEFDGFLSKPYTSDQLLSALTRALQSRQRKL